MEHKNLNHEIDYKVILTLVRPIQLILYVFYVFYFWPNIRNLETCHVNFSTMLLE